MILLVLLLMLFLLAAQQLHIFHPGCCTTYYAWLLDNYARLFLTLQVGKWLLNPVDKVIADIKKQFPQNTTIADLGCGDAKLATCLKPLGYTVSITYFRKKIRFLKQTPQLDQRKPTRAMISLRRAFILTGNSLLVNLVSANSSEVFSLRMLNLRPIIISLISSSYTALTFSPEFIFHIVSSDSASNI